MLFEKIPVAILFIMSLLIGIIGPYMRKYYLEKAYYRQSQNVLITFLMMFGCLFYFLIAGGFKIQASNISILLGLLYGSITAVYILFQVIATNTGPLSYTTVIISLSTVITALSGAIL